MRGCELAGCQNRATGTISACGTVYVCDGCRAQITELASMYAADTTATAHTWMPSQGDTVTQEGYDGVWVVDGYEDDDTVWLYRPGTRMVPAYGRLYGWVDLSPGRLVPEHTELAAVAALRPALQAEVNG